MSRARGQLTPYRGAMNSLKSTLTKMLEKREARKHIRKLEGLKRRIKEMIEAEERKIRSK